MRDVHSKYTTFELNPLTMSTRMIKAKEADKSIELTRSIKMNDSANYMNDYMTQSFDSFAISRRIPMTVRRDQSN